MDTTEGSRDFDGTGGSWTEEVVVSYDGWPPSVSPVGVGMSDPSTEVRVGS